MRTVVAMVVALALSMVDGQAAAVPAARQPVRWVATWASSQQATEPANLPPAPGFADTTLRQLVRVSIGGRTLRVRFSNAFGRTPLTLHAASIAKAAGGRTIAAVSAHPLAFAGRPTVTIPEGAMVVSDPVDFEIPAMADLAVTVHLRGAPEIVTGHPGSRTTSYLQPGSGVAAVDLPDAVPVDHWYFLAGIDVDAGTRPAASAIAIIGDSITDGRGSPTNGNDRWTDILSRRLRGAKSTAEVAVLNQGVGGNRLLRDGLGQNVLARFDRDVLAQPGVRWLIVFEGVNDIGTSRGDRAKGLTGASAQDLIDAYRQILARAHAHGIRVYGATIMAFEGFSMYDTPEAEADRQAVNEWIRTSGAFDAVIDFDRLTRDPASPKKLSATVDGGDHLHPSAAGYRTMGESIDLTLFSKPPAR
jgi:lysophospholipase L1-like esterase